MELSEGQYYYSPHRSLWGIWRVGKEINGLRTNKFVADCSTKEEAEERVYKLNGWSKSTK